jgi:hypothetical protein
VRSIVSKWDLRRRVGTAFGDFKTAAFDRSATSPRSFSLYFMRFFPRRSRLC